MTDHAVTHSKTTRPLVPSRAVVLGTLLLIALVAVHLMWLVFSWGGETHRALLVALPCFTASPDSHNAGMT